MQSYEPINPRIRYWILGFLVPFKGINQLDTLTDSDHLLDSILPCKQEAHIGRGRPRLNTAELREQLQRAWTAVSQTQGGKVPQRLQSNVRKISAIAGFSEAESRVLEFVICLHGYPEMRLASETLDEINNKTLIQLLASLLGLSLEAVRQSLRCNSKLQRSGLIEARGLHYLGGSPAPMTVKLELPSNNVAEALINGQGSPEELLYDTVKIAPLPTLKLSDYGDIKEYLAVAISYLKAVIEDRSHGVNILLHGSPGTGKTQLAGLLAAATRCKMYEVLAEDSAGDQIQPGGRLSAYRSAQYFFSSKNVMLLFDEVEEVLPKPGAALGLRNITKSWMNQMLEDNSIPAVWISNSVDCMDPAMIRRFDIVIELNEPNTAQRLKLLKKYAPSGLDKQLLQRLAHQEHLTPAVIERAAKVVGKASKNTEEMSNAMEMLLHSTLRAQGHKLAGAHRGSDNKAGKASFDPYLLQADVNLKDMVPMLKEIPEARICLYGPPGTGKTAYGYWLAHKLGKELLLRRASDILGAYVGQSEENIANAFKEATENSAILMIDEVDSFLSDRRGASRSWEVSIVNEMLTQMENFDGTFISTTNRMNDLDQAVLRRFDLKAKFDFLGEQQVYRAFSASARRLGLKMKPALKRELAAMKWLTPGDFSVVERRARFRPLIDANALLHALMHEMRFKEQAQQRRIGF